MRIANGLLIGWLASSCWVNAQPLVSGPQVATFFSSVDDTDQPYGLYLPKNFDQRKRYPLVISLHGAFSNHRLNLKRVFGKGNKDGESDAEATRYWPPMDGPNAMRAVEMIVASPLARGTLGYVGIPEQDVYDVLDDVKKRFLIDEDRVYLTGLSMGGGGTLYLGLTRPDLWAAIAPVCPAPPAGTDALAGNALNYPVKLFQGDADPVVRPEGTRRWVEKFKELGVATEYVEYPGVKHNSWDNAYADAAVFDWFAKFKRNPMPERVRFASRMLKYSKAYWVRFDSFATGALASIDAKITKPGVIEITTANLDGFSLMLDASRKWTVSIDGQTLSPRTLSFTRDGAWKEAKAIAPAKMPGVEGPIPDVLSKRHIYVYGTADNPPADELTRRRQEAERLANWSQPRLPLMLTLRALADREVRDGDLAGANVVLIGTKSTNSLIAKHAAGLAMQLRPDAADYTLLMAAPIEGRQALIVSGKTPAAVTPRPFVPGIVTDFVVMKAGTPVATGNFDRNWKLSDEQRRALSDTGVIEIAP